MADSWSDWALARRRLKLAVMILIILLAAGLRLYELNTESLWGDEVFEAVNAQRNLTSILSTSPLALRLSLAHVFSLVGRQELILRFPYAIMGILGVAAMYRVGRTLFDDTTAVVGAFLLATSLFHIYHSRVARSYSLTVFLVLASLYCVYRALQDNQLKHWAGFAIITALSLNNNLIAASVVVSELAFGISVLLVERYSRTDNRQDGRNPNLPRGHRWQDTTRAWAHRVRSSRGAMLALSLILGMLLFLLSSGFWFSYVARGGVSIVGPGTASDGGVMRLSAAYLENLLRDFGAGRGGALVLYGVAFLAGLASCAVRRQWRQLLLAPIWILPPFLALPNMSASLFFGNRHLIFILPIYLLFVAKGIVGTSALVARYAGRSLGTRRLVYVVSVALVVGTVLWLNLARALAYYGDQKAEAKEAAAFLHQHSNPGDLVFQLLSFPRDALPYYTDGYGESAKVKYVWFDDIDGDEPLTEVWWVFFVPPPQNRLQTSGTPESLMGPDDEVQNFNYISIARRRRPIEDLADFWRLTVRLFYAQSQLDQPRRFGWYKDRLVQAYGMMDPPQVLSPDCPPELSDPTGYLQVTWAHIQDGQTQEALQTLQKARALHEVLYLEGRELDGSIAQGLHELGDDALASGSRACASELFSRAADAYLLALEAEGGNADLWHGLASASFKAERYEDAIRAYERLLQLAPDHARYRIRLARAYRANGQVDEAIAVLEQAIELAPGEWRPLLELGNTYLLLERANEAVAAYQRTLEVDAAISEAHFGLALAYDAQGRTALAIRQYQTVIEIDPEHWLARQAEERLAEPNQ